MSEYISDAEKLDRLNWIHSETTDGYCSSCSMSMDSLVEYPCITARVLKINEKKPKVKDALGRIWTYEQSRKVYENDELGLWARLSDLEKIGEVTEV